MYLCPRTPPIIRPAGATTRFNVSSIISSASAKASRSRIWWTKMPAIKEEVRSQEQGDRSQSVSFADIAKAADRIKLIVKRTPIMTSRSFDSASGVAAFFKCENLQTGGAFKIRGASHFVFSIAKEQLPKG